MIEVQVPQNIQEHKSKIFANFTARQVVCLGIGVVVYLLSWNLFKNFFPDAELTTKIIACAIPAAIPMAFGFLQIQGQPLEKMGVVYLKENFLAPGVRLKEYRHPELERWEKDPYKTADEATAKKIAAARRSGKKDEFHVKRSRNYKGLR